MFWVKRGTIPVRKMKRGSEGRDEVRARPSVLVLSADWDLGREIW